MATPLLRPLIKVAVPVGTGLALREYQSSKFGRRNAVKYTEQFEEGTVGSLVHHTVKPFSTVFGDFASGSIGAHYKEREEFLKKPATSENIRELATTETAWWNQQRGLPGWVGSRMSAENRELTLNARKSYLMKSGKFPSSSTGSTG